MACLQEARRMLPFLPGLFGRTLGSHGKMDILKANKAQLFTPSTSSTYSTLRTCDGVQHLIALAFTGTLAVNVFSWWGSSNTSSPDKEFSLVARISITQEARIAEKAPALSSIRSNACGKSCLLVTCNIIILILSQQTRNRILVFS